MALKYMQDKMMFEMITKEKCKSRKAQLVSCITALKTAVFTVD
jgi:hypothetical protein